LLIFKIKPKFEEWKAREADLKERRAFEVLAPRFTTLQKELADLNAQLHQERLAHQATKSKAKKDLDAMYSKASSEIQRQMDAVRDAKNSLEALKQEQAGVGQGVAETGFKGVF
jgi:predicted  nucleic acid-binding Zn-ribbon protein